MQSGSTFARPLLKGEERGAGIALENEPVKNERRRVKMSERTFEVFAHFVNASFSSRVMEGERERERERGRERDNPYIASFYLIESFSSCSIALVCL